MTATTTLNHRVLDSLNTPSGTVGVIGDDMRKADARWWKKNITFVDLSDRPDLTIAEALEAIAADPREIDFILVDRHIPAKWGEAS